MCVCVCVCGQRDLTTHGSFHGFHPVVCRFAELDHEPLPLEGMVGGLDETVQGDQVLEEGEQPQQEEHADKDAQAEQDVQDQSLELAPLQLDELTVEPKVCVCLVCVCARVCVCLVFACVCLVFACVCVCVCVCCSGSFQHTHPPKHTYTRAHVHHPVTGPSRCPRSDQSG